MSKQLINPAELYHASANGMSQAVFDEQSGLVFISGQIDWNHQFETSENTVAGQTKKALANLEIALKAAGSSVEDLLRVRVYVRGELGEQMSQIAPIIRDFLGESRPALTGIGVASLVAPDVLVEIEAVARRGGHFRNTSAENPAIYS
jgi:enamine deaminase RidA (YjgF/YER057c/UK114 family)